MVLKRLQSGRLLHIIQINTEAKEVAAPSGQMWLQEPLMGGKMFSILSDTDGSWGKLASLDGDDQADCGGNDNIFERNHFLNLSWETNDVSLTPSNSLRPSPVCACVCICVHD
eukprot:COSAG02_NODE_7816_length_2835_cov_1.917398_4_plen_113_part_00